MNSLLAPVKEFAKILVTVKAPLKAYAKENDFFFIQIGACDGVSSDPIHNLVKKHNWPGVFVEPVPYLFNELKNNYKEQEQVSFENVAISSTNKSRSFYYYDDRHEGNVPYGCRGKGSFSIEQAKKDPPPLARKNIIKETVRCITLANLLNKYNRSSVSFLQIDTEGYDFEIIKQVDFSTLKPKIINYEHIHLSPSDQKECEELLRHNGYCVNRNYIDTCAFKVPESPETKRCLNREIVKAVVINSFIFFALFCKRTLKRFARMILEFFGFRIRYYYDEQALFTFGKYSFYRLSKK